MYGADPIEFPPQPWKYAAPVLDLTAYPVDRHLLRAEGVARRRSRPAAAELETAVEGSAWTNDELAAARAEIHRRAHAGGRGGHPAEHRRGGGSLKGSAAAR
jgi:hypothetical protein